MSDPQALHAVLETIVYCDPDNHEATSRFYSEVLGLRRVSKGIEAYRLGASVFLVFDRTESGEQDDPPPHGATGSVHACFLTDPEHYETWKQHIASKGVSILQESTWPNDVRSFYFHDPAGNLLEIADGDLWPR